MLFLILIGSVAAMLYQVNKHFLVEVPSRGGTITEGVIGTPRFINPLLASSDADRDLTMLVYSGLMRVGPNGQLIDDLAASHTVSDDGLTYTFKIRPDAVWQDGYPVTADDVVFTIQKAQDPALHSPHQANWGGVTVKKIDDHTVQFTLSQAYAPFLQITTIGILPKHIWQNVTDDQFIFSTYNTEPVGTGPYRMQDVRTNGKNIPTEYDLTPFNKFVLGSPHIAHINFRFYNNEDDLTKAFRSGDITSMSAISAQTAAALTKDNYRVLSAALPRVYGVFFNQSHAQVFTDPAVREALNEAVDKQAIVNNVLAGYGTVIDGPIPPGTLGYTPPTQETATSSAARITAAQKILTDAGWVYDASSSVFMKKSKTGTETLSFTLSTASDVPDLLDTAEALKQTWTTLGAQVTVDKYDLGNLSQDIIRPREYDALLFGEVLGRDSDPFAFWHSSQRLDPGLNIALYANSSVDKLLEKARTTLDPTARAQLFQQFNDAINKDMPAIFLYSPDFFYAVPNDLQGIDIQPISISSGRFANVYQWYTNTQYIWKIFVPNNTIAISS